VRAGIHNHRRCKNISDTPGLWIPGSRVCAPRNDEMRIRSRGAVIPAERQREPESITTDGAEEFLTHRDYGFRVRTYGAPRNDDALLTAPLPPAGEGWGDVKSILATSCLLSLPTRAKRVAGRDQGWGASSSPLSPPPNFAATTPPPLTPPRRCAGGGERATSFPRRIICARALLTTRTISKSGVPVFGKRSREKIEDDSLLPPA